MAVAHADVRRGAADALAKSLFLPGPAVDVQHHGKTYRVSVEFRRMTEKGDLIDVATPSAADQAAEDMIVYAPRRVTLAPHEPQAIRIAARAPQRP